MKEVFNLVVLNLFHYLIFLISLPFFSVVMIVMYVYKSIVFLILRISNDPSHITRLNSADTFWTIGNPRHNTVEGLILLDSSSRKFEDLVGVVKQSAERKILRNSALHPKLTSTLEIFMGYGYLRKVDVTPNDFIYVVNVNEDNKLMTKNLTEVTSEIANMPLPLNNRFLWDMVLIRASDEWRKKHLIKENQFPIIVRCHHLIGDGFAIINHFVQNFADNEIDISESLATVKKFMPPKKNYVMKVFENVHKFLVVPAYVLIPLFTKVHDIWITPQVAYKKRLFIAKDIDNGMVDSIKSMKNKIGDTTFSEVILTAISASLENYFEKLPDKPKYGQMVMVVVGELLKSLNDSVGNADLKNQFSFVIVKLPICTEARSLVDRLDLVKTETRRVARTSQLWVTYIVLTYVAGLFPLGILRKLMPITNIAICFSNIPCVPKVTMWNGHEIENVFFFTPSKNQLGVAFIALTYDNRLHLGLIADEVIIPSDNDAQKIIDGVLKNITLLKNEVLSRPEQHI